MVDQRALDEARRRRGLLPTEPVTGGVELPNPRLTQPEPIVTPQAVQEETGGGGFGGALGRLFEVASSGDAFLGAISGGRLEVPDDPLFFDEAFDLVANPIGIAAIASEVFLPGNPIGTGLLAGRIASSAPLATRIALATGAEAAVSGAAVGGARVAERIIPDNAPGIVNLGGALIGGAVGGAAGIRGIRAVRGPRVPRETANNVTSFVVEGGGTAKEIEDAAFLDQILPQWRAGGDITIDNDTLNAANSVWNVMLRNAENESVMQGMFLASADNSTLRSNPLIARRGLPAMGRVPGVGWLARWAAPASQESLQVQSAMAAREGALNSVYQVMAIQLDGVERRFADVLGNTRLQDIFDETGRVLPEFIEYKPVFREAGKFRKATQAELENPAAGLARHIFLHPDDYVFKVDGLKDAVNETALVVNNLAPLKHFAGADFNPISDWFGTQRWIDALPESEAELKALGEGIAETYQRTLSKPLIGELGERTMTLEQGIKAGRTPIPMTFQDVVAAEFEELGRRFADFEAERVATLWVDDFDGLRTHTSRERVIRDLKEARRNALKERRELRSRLNGNLQALTRASGRAAGKADEIPAAVRREEVLQAFRESRAEAIVRQAEVKFQTIRQIRSQVSRLVDKEKGVAEAYLQGLLDEAAGTFGWFTDASNEALRSINRNRKVLERLRDQLLRKEITAQKAKSLATTALDNILANESPNLTAAIRRAEAAQDAAARFRQYERAVRTAFKNNAPYPEELVPSGFSDTRIRNTYELLFKNAEEITGSKAKIDVLNGNRTSPEVAREVARIRKEIKQIVRNTEVGDERILSIGRFSDNIRESVLTLDFSVFGIQGLARFIENPIKGTADLARSVRFMLSDKGFEAWRVANMDEIADANRHGLQLFRHTASEITPRGLVGADKRRPAIESVPLLGTLIANLNDRMFGRGVAYMKFQTWRANVMMLDATRNNKGWAAKVRNATGVQSVSPDYSLSQIKRLSADYVNNLYGGLSPARLGVNRNQRAIEKSLILTPDYLRATVGLAASAGRNTPEGVLAREFLAKGFMYIAGMAAVMGLMSGEMPNIFQPERKDWLFVKTPLPNDELITVNPFGRFRTLFRTLLIGPATVRDTGDPQQGADRALDSFGRFLSGRGATLPSTASNIFTDKDFFGNPIRTQGGFAGKLEQAWFAARQTSPIIIQSLFEDDSVVPSVGFQTIPELFGVSSFRTEANEINAIRALSRAAVRGGVPQELVRDQLSRNQNPLNALDENGQRILDIETRNLLIEQVIEETGFERDLVFRLGRDEQPFTVEGQKAAERDLTSRFFDMNDFITKSYESERDRIERTILAQENPNFSAYSRALTDLRIQRRSQYDTVYAEDGPFSPILENLNDPERLAELNEKDILFQRYKDLLNDPAFIKINPFTGVEEFDFDAQNAREAQLEADPTFGPFVNDFKRRLLEGKSELEIERDIAFQSILAPYWAARDSAWRSVGGESVADSFEAFESERGHEPLFARLPLVRAYQRRLQRERDTLRLRDPALEFAIVKWLGLQPIRFRRR